MRQNFRQLGELCDKDILLIDPKREPEKSFWYVDISAVDNTTKRIATPQQILGKQASVRARQVIRKDDVLVSTTRPNLNAVALVPAEYAEEICSTGFCVLRCGSELDPEYLFSFVQSQLFVGALSELVKGALYPAVTDKQVFAQSIPWVPLDDQRRIATQLKAQLATVEEARQAAQAQAKEAELLTQRIREDALPELAHAERVVLGDLLIGIEAGKSFQTSDRLARDDELGVLKVSAVSWARFQADEAKAIDDAYSPDERHRVKAGDLLISRANTVELVGAVVRVDRDYPNRLLSDKTLRLLVDEQRICPGYLLQALRLPEARAHIEGNATGTSNSMRNISQDTLRAIPIPLPPLPIQQRIAERLHNAEIALSQLKQALDASLKDIDLLPARLLAQAFGES